MTNPGAGANKIFVAIAPVLVKYLKRFEALAPEKMLGFTAPGSGFPTVVDMY